VAEPGGLLEGQQGGRHDHGNRFVRDHGWYGNRFARDHTAGYGNRFVRGHTGHPDWHQQAVDGGALYLAGHGNPKPRGYHEGVAIDIDTELAAIAPAERLDFLRMIGLTMWLTLQMPAKL